jgi:serine phosphatase RsbU (regulator of sigma subunit)
VKPWGLLGVILVLQVRTVNDYFFRLVYWLYDLSGSSHALAFIGHAFFRFWAKPLA